MVHGNARLTALTRRELVQQVADGWPVAEVARQFRVSRATAYKWVRRYCQGGRAALEDRPSRPHSCPRRTPAPLESQICAIRRKEGWGPHRIAWALKVARSTVYAVLKRHGLSRLDHLHRVTRRPVRYERDTAGDLLHLDVKKLGRIPEGGGKRFAAGFSETQSGPHSRESTVSTSLSTTTAATPTSRPCQTSVAQPRPASWNVPWPTTKHVASRSASCSQTTP